MFLYKEMLKKVIDLMCQKQRHLWWFFVINCACKSDRKLVPVSVLSMILLGRWGTLLPSVSLQGAELTVPQSPLWPLSPRLHNPSIRFLLQDNVLSALYCTVLYCTVPCLRNYTVLYCTVPHRRNPSIRFLLWDNVWSAPLTDALLSLTKEEEAFLMSTFGNISTNDVPFKPFVWSHIYSDYCGYNEQSWSTLWNTEMMRQQCYKQCRCRDCGAADTLAGGHRIVYTLY